MTNHNVRVRFAPSPTGPLHIGGVRTALYNYLFAKKNNGAFLLRIEDTDQSRRVEGAEEYIMKSLDWLGLSPDEGVTQGGPVGPYRQSDRREIYSKYVQYLIQKGHAYYAFDSIEELDLMRKKETAAGNHNPKYDSRIRMKMKNSLTLSTTIVEQLVEQGHNVTVRLKVPEDEMVSFDDQIRGKVEFSTAELDDKVIMKADGLPTYHLANVVDDHLMKISHVIRGEEWLSSTAHHVLLYRFLGWEDQLPAFAHLPLIMKPSGKGKLSKRDGAKFGFPVFPMEWYDHNEQTTYFGFNEEGFIPAALINFLAFLGWNPGTEQEIFSLDELVDSFSIDRISKSGAQFNFEKAKWFNQHYIIKEEDTRLIEKVRPFFSKEKISINDELMNQVIELLRPRVELLREFVTKGQYFWSKPASYDEKIIRKKFKSDNTPHFAALIAGLEHLDDWSVSDIEIYIKGYIKDNGLKFGEILPMIRVWLTGSMEGPDLFPIIHLLGSAESVERLQTGLINSQSQLLA